MATILYWQDDESGETEHVQFDVVESETPEDVLTVTDHPIEEGANVSDHARLEPASLTIEGFVSAMLNPLVDTDLTNESLEINVPRLGPPGRKSEALDIPEPPIQPSQSGLLQAGIGAIKSLFTGGPKFVHESTRARSSETVHFTAVQQREPRDRIRDVYELLLKAQARKLLVTVHESHREHFDMLITRVAKPKATEDGKAARFQVDLRQIFVADSETVAAPQPTEARGKTGVSMGSRNVKKDPNAAAKEEILQSTIDLIGGGDAAARLIRGLFGGGG